MYRPVAPKKEMTRSEIADVFIIRAAPADREQLRRVLDKMSLAELEQAYQALQTQNHLQAQEEELARIAVETEADRILHEESMRLAREPQRKAEEKALLEADRKTFIQAAKSLQSFGVTEANFNVTRQILGPGFSSFGIQEGISSNALQLSPATQQEIEEWTREAKEAEIRRLKNMDLTSLRKLVRDQGPRGPVAPPLDETQRVRQAERADGITYPPLPDEIWVDRNGIVDLNRTDPMGREETVDAAFIYRCHKKTMQFLMTHFGSKQVDEALRTRRPGGSPLW